MNKFKIQNGEHTIINLDNIETIEKLDPKKCYLVNFNADYGYYYLTVAENLELPGKVYGDKSHIDKYLKKYNCHNRNLGVLLSGIKGDGKSVDAKVLAIKAAQPIVIINSGFRDQGFLEFISNPLFNNTTIFIDEFEKIYASDNPEVSTVNILKLLDGYSNNKNLFIMTSNEMNISRYLINRPSRIRYVKEYNGLSFELITEIVADKLKDQSIIETTLNTLEEYPLMTMDVLLEIINDINDLEISCAEAIKDLNFTSEKKKLNLKANISFADQKIKYNFGQASLTHHLNQLINGNPGLWIDSSKLNIEGDEDGELHVSLPKDEAFIESIKEEFSKKFPDKVLFDFEYKGIKFEIEVYEGSMDRTEYIRAF